MNIELMKEVRARVLKDYKKVNMGNWILKVTKALIKQREQEIKEGWAEPTESLKAMSCSTAGCIAGHTLFAALPVKLIKFYQERGYGINTTAAALLQLKKVEAQALFMFFSEDEYTYDESGEKVDIDNSWYAEEREALKAFIPGTKGYAKVCARAIDKCIARNQFN